MVTFRYGANEGVNLGISVATGGQTTVGKRSIQPARGISAVPKFRKRLWAFFARLMKRIFGGRNWYKSLCRKVGGLKERTILDTPISGLWYTIVAGVENVHTDLNTRGVAMVLTTSNVKGTPHCTTAPPRGITRHVE